MNSEYIIGIGASAGGLEAINELFDNIPANTNYSYVVIQHLSPDYKSLMSELLAKHTRMDVYEAEENMPLAPNCVYLLPARKTMTIKGGKFKLQDKVKSAKPNTAIDIFFESLALEKREKAIGIILSGTGSDGTMGIEAIKSNGGIVIVQDPITAEFDGMPNSAVATGCADLILSPDMIPDELLEYLKESPFLKAFNILNHKEETILLDIFEIIHRQSSFDFSHYKRPTITRRLAKRMAEGNFKSIADYYEFLKKDANEVKALCREFLINVTKFFRDEEAFDVLRKTVIPNLFKGKQPGDTIKLWTVACSTGEEAYSLAMLLHNYMEQNDRFDVNAKIFATDIDEEAIEIASKGVYTELSMRDLPQEMVQKFFTKEATSYRVIPVLRKMVVFAKHDVSKDPPFSKVDFLSCRNMLIYMTPLLQKAILHKLHFALNQDGYLFLGPSENIGTLKDVMKDVEKKWKIYRCNSKARPGDHDTFLNPLYRGVHLDMSLAPKPKNAQNNIAEIFKETLLEEYEFAGIFIDKDFEVKQAIGNFKKFINFPEGNFNFNLLKLVPADLAISLGTAIRTAMKDDKKVVMRRVKVTDGKSERSINIVVKPYIVQKTYSQPFLFVVLSEDLTEQKPAKELRSKDELISRKIEELETELRDTKLNLQAVIEEVESANEELQSSNEEIISSNEELQSTNEELQSLNEELHTVNVEHQLKIKELVELNDDMNNYFRNTEIGQIFVDKHLVIKKFSPIATKQINFIASDVGRNIRDFSINFRNIDFMHEIKRVVDTGVQVEREIVMEDGETHLLRIAPYVKQDKTQDGAVINFINITEVKRLTSIIEAIFNSSPSGILAQQAVKNEHGEVYDLKILRANNAIDELFGCGSESLTGASTLSTFPEFALLHFDKYSYVLETGEDCRFEYFDIKKSRWLDVIITVMLDGVVTTFTDITEAKKSFDALRTTSDMLRASNTQLEQSNYDLLQFASVASHDLKEPLRKIQTFGNKLKERAEEKLFDQERDYLYKIIGASHRMQNLIEDILTLSKLSNNAAERTSVSLNDVLANIIDDLEIMIKEKKAVVKVDTLQTIIAIPGQMHQLFQNLVSNAIKFNESKPPVVTVAQSIISNEMCVRLKIDSAKFICIKVTDNGIGFESAYADKIFGVFQRLNGTRYPGTGIGLAICKKIVDNHNGHIYATSELDQGTTFTILLPIDKL